MGTSAHASIRGAGRPGWSSGHRLAGLRRFAIAITLLNVFGHGLLGFEPSCAQPVFAVGFAYVLEVLLEWSGARCDGRAPRFADGARLGTRRGRGFFNLNIESGDLL